ncbi:MAG: histidine kinase [Nonlabens sp.]|nr:histidine kinase [Nonlabens sp.]MDP5100647.1 histidine kinase [Nonlabens sp.]
MITENRFKLKLPSSRELLGIFLFYLFFAIIYHIVLGYINYDPDRSFADKYLGLSDFWERAGMQYLFFFVGSIFIWFAGIWLFRSFSTAVQIVVTTLLIPAVIYVLRVIRYAILDSYEIWHLQGPSAVWDLYIPSLFLGIQFGCFFAYRYFKENQRKLKIEGELRQAALKSELAAIKAQLNPHFLYNVFNTINASLPAENERTRNMIAQLADIFRYQLQATKTDTVTLKEELDFVRKYLNLEKERFEERLEINIHVDESLLREKVPPMLLQPLVENSIKHGIASLIQGGSITIEIFKQNGKLKFIIADTGVGVVDKTDLMNKGIGLTNTRLRLQKMYNASMEILDNEPQGLKIQFEI